MLERELERNNIIIQGIEDKDNTDQSKYWEKPE